MNLTKLDKIVLIFLLMILFIGGFGKNSILIVIPFGFIYFIMRDNLLRVFGFNVIDKSEDEELLDDLKEEK